MQFVTETINCPSFDNNTKRTTPFRVVKFVFNYKSSAEDRQFLNDLIKKGEILAGLVNRGAANNSTYARNLSRVVNNCIAGLLAEYVWKQYLNNDAEIVQETELVEVKTQIDLKIVHNSKTIEVRSSFPRNGIKFALCHNRYQFDVIGPYLNTYKPGEVQKDYYVRTLFPFQSNQLLDKLKEDNFEVYLTGGATWNMMGTEGVAINKDFIPEDEIEISRLETRSYYKVVPFSEALDTLEIAEQIIKGE